MKPLRDCAPLHETKRWLLPLLNGERHLVGQAEIEAWCHAQVGVGHPGLSPIMGYDVVEWVRARLARRTSYGDSVTAQNVFDMLKPGAGLIAVYRENYIANQALCSLWSQVPNQPTHEPPPTKTVQDVDALVAKFAEWT